MHAPLCFPLRSGSFELTLKLAAYEWGPKRGLYITTCGPSQTGLLHNVKRVGGFLLILWRSFLGKRNEKPKEKKKTSFSVQKDDTRQSHCVIPSERTICHLKGICEHV